MRTGYAWYKLSAAWLNDKSFNNISTPLSGTLEPGYYNNCKVIKRNKNVVIVRDLHSNKDIESGSEIASSIQEGSLVEMQVTLYGDYIITVKGDGSFYACDPVSKRVFNKVPGPSIQWVREWAESQGLKEQRPIIISIKETL